MEKNNKKENKTMETIAAVVTLLFSGYMVYLGLSILF